MQTQTVVINTSIIAASQLLNYFANNITVFDGVMLIATDNGLLTPSVTSQEVVGSKISLPKSDLGYHGYKTPRTLIVGCKCTGLLKITIKDDNDISKVYYTRMLDNEDGCKVALDSDQRSRYFDITIENLDGCEFILKSIDMVFIKCSDRSFVNRNASTEIPIP